MTTTQPDKPHPYKSLHDVLVAAYQQAAEGKGNVRHAAGRAFDDQPILTFTRMYGLGFPFGQASKKMEESLRMDKDAATQELLGAIVYIAAAVVHLQTRQEADQ